MKKTLIVATCVALTSVWIPAYADDDAAMREAGSDFQALIERNCHLL